MALPCFLRVRIESYHRTNERERHMSLPTEPIGSMPREPSLLMAIAQKGYDAPELEPLYEEAVRDTIARFEDIGSPVVTDGEQRKYHNFWTYCVHGLSN